MSEEVISKVQIKNKNLFEGLLYLISAFLLFYQIVSAVWMFLDLC